MPAIEWSGKKETTPGFHLGEKKNGEQVLNAKCLWELLRRITSLLPANTHRDTLWLNFLIVLFRCWIIFWLLKTIIAKPNNKSNWISCLRGYSWFTIGCRRGRRQIRGGEKSRSNFCSMKSTDCLHGKKAWDGREFLSFRPILLCGIWKLSTINTITAWTLASAPGPTTPA